MAAGDHAPVPTDEQHPEEHADDEERSADEQHLADEHPADHGPDATRTGGELVPGTETAPGAVVTASGRISAAVEYGPEKPTSPFNAAQLSRLDEALTMASRETGLRFNLFLGELGPNPKRTTRELFDSLGPAGDRSVVIAVSPEQRVVEVLTGERAATLLPDRGAKLGVMSMVAEFKDGHLLEGLIKGLRMLADQAVGRRP